MDKLKVAIVFGGCSEEHPISVKSAQEVARHLDPEKYEPFYIGITQRGAWKLCDGGVDADWQNGRSRPAVLSPDRSVRGLLVLDEGPPARYETIGLDVVLPVLHGKLGEDGAIQGLLELSGIPYAGCDVQSSALCMDKPLAYMVARSAGIATPDFRTVAADEDIEAGRLVYPVFVKPARSGSSFGVSRVSHEAALPRAVQTARQYDSKVVIEAAVDGSEVGCAVLGNDRDLLTGEVDRISLSHGFFRIHQESEPESGSENSTPIVPADISPEARSLVQTTAKALYRALGCSGLARVDLFLKDDGTVVLNEVNTLPGMTSYSRYPRMMAAAGLPLAEVIDRVVSLALAGGTAGAAAWTRRPPTSRRRVLTTTGSRRETAPTATSPSPMRCSASELAAHVGGELVGPDVGIEGASIDSRTIRPGRLYAPIVAARDGHAFIAAALEAGAPAYLPAQEPVGATAIRVRDTAAALLSLAFAGFARGRVGGAIGVTGSVGKTTTKDLLAACLASTFRTAASEGSFNNELGLPLTLLNAPQAVRWVVLEMGVRREGDIERLAEVARPDVGIVTSVDLAHVEHLGDLDGVARAKSELVAALPASGLAVLNFDDPRVRAMAPLSRCPVLGYGVGGGADVRAEDVTLDRDLRARFRLSSPWGQAEVRLALHGVQQVPNALAAATVALWCGVPIEAVAAALAVRRGSPWRMEVRHVPGGPVLVVDCFNAIPASAEAAVRSLAALPGGRKLAVLGLMAELGDRSEAEHRRIARVAEELGIEVVGYATRSYGEACVAGVDEAVALLRTMGPGDAALVKGSRVARLEDVVRAYEEAGGAPCP
jgi:UDP-N-acetylmuramoyl-tripeptide--D-alanyl-D-alanine ligase/D-alanine--D-alanine ligase